MYDYLDKEIWIGLLILTFVLYLIKWCMSRRKNTVYRISPESLQKSKTVMLSILPLIEDQQESLIDEARLPYPKDRIKSAAKILAYFYWKEDQHEEFKRVKNCYISVARFQDSELEDEMAQRRIAREKERLTKEFELYIAHSRIGVKKAA